MVLHSCVTPLCLLLHDGLWPDSLAACLQWLDTHYHSTKLTTSPLQQHLSTLIDAVFSFSFSCFCLKCHAWIVIWMHKKLGTCCGCKVFFIKRAIGDKPKIFLSCQEQLNKNSFITIIICHCTNLLTDQIEFTIPSSFPWKDFSKIYKSLIFLGSEVYFDNFRLSSFCCF